MSGRSSLSSIGSIKKTGKKNTWRISTRATRSRGTRRTKKQAMDISRQRDCRVPKGMETDAENRAREQKAQTRPRGRSNVRREYVRTEGRGMSDSRKHLERSLQDEEFAREWKEQSAKRDVMRQIVEARMKEGLTQQELAERCGMKASNLCRLENGNGNPSVATLEKIARVLGRRLEISFV